MRAGGCDILQVVDGGKRLGHITRADIERCRRHGNWLDAVLVVALMGELRRTGAEVDEAVLAQTRRETLKAYEDQMSAYYATSQIWDDGLIDPVDTRNALGMAISVSLNAPLGERGYGVFRL